MKYFVTTLLLAISGALSAQYNIGTTYGNHNDLNASKYQPSELDLGDKKFQIGFNYYLWMGNTTFNYANIRKAYKSDNIDFLEPNAKKNNLLGAGQDYQLLSVAYQFKVDETHKYVFGFSIVDKFAMNFLYTDKYLALALKGNKQFAGQTVPLGPTTVNASYTREFVISHALPIFGDENKGLRLGIRTKLLQGLGSMYMPKGNASITTEQDGRYINMDFDYAIYTAGLSDFSFLKTKGLGWGLDLGLTWFVSKNFEISGSVLDLGGVSYYKGTRSYTKTGSGHYEGLVIDNLFGGSKQNLDSANAIIDANKTRGGTFYMPQGSKVCVELEYKTPKKDKGNNHYTSNSIFLTYIQGINKYPGATTRPFLSLGYNHDFHKFLDAGLMMSYGGYNNFALGSFLSLNFNNSFKIGLSSDNLTALIAPKAGTGIGFAANCSLSF